MVNTLHLCEPSLSTPISLDRGLGIVLYAIGIGEEINKEELISIAGDEERVFLVENFDKLNDLMAKIQILPPAELLPVPPKPKGRGIKCVQVRMMKMRMGMR